MRKARVFVGAAVAGTAVVAIGKSRSKTKAKRREIASAFRRGLKDRELAEGLKFKEDNYQFNVSELVDNQEDRKHYKVQVIDLRVVSPMHSDYVFVLNYYLPTENLNDGLSWQPHRARQGIDWF